MATIKHNTASLAAAVRPGVTALVAAELQSIVEEAVEEVKAQLVLRLKPHVEVRVQDVLSEPDMRVVVNVEVREYE